MSTLPNIVFLDIDGVLCTHRACEATGNKGPYSYLDPIACLLVKRLCLENKAKIVISSAWRYEHTREGLEAILNAACPDLGKFIWEDRTWWRTPDFTPGVEGDNISSRGREILKWITANLSRFDEYVILDDLEDLRPLQHSLVHCDPFDGIGYKEYRAAVAMLNPARDT